MLEIRIKSNSLDETNKFILFLRSNPFNGFVFYNFSKVYLLKDGRHKFFAECVDYKTYKALETLNYSADSAPMVKKRGRKPKTLQTL